MADETVPERIARRAAERAAKLQARADARAEARKGSDSAAALHKAQIAAATSTELLAALIAKGTLQTAPSTITLATDAGFQILTVGIGSDHTASVIIDAESLEALKSYDVSN